MVGSLFFFFFQAEDGIRGRNVTGVQTCALPIWEVPGIAPMLLAAHAVLGDYPQIGLADAMNVVLAREFRTDVIATLDRRHFRMIRPMTRHDTFRLLPDDVPGA